ncbi:DUF5696 domain-containing protein [Cohnella fermenti]|uniref:DUF4852 domain-containing protein n=1 Tax=Cohnella fermenti TaxID=2565925 RepID=A0A4V3WDY4_9BACL|nr:DUF5696 domain-containing protein [Cohnella fermenti]THF74077.1 hypothetical protein E6C55_26685 [Cohnella fermenti]
MNRLKGVLWAAVLLAGMSAAGCSGSGNGSSAAQADESALSSFEAGTALTAAFTDTKVEGMKGVAENDRLRLFADDQTGVVAVLDKNSGKVWYSNPSDRDSDTLASGVNKDLLSAQLRIDFYNNFGQLNSVNSYTDSVAHNQIKMEPIEGGVRIDYQFGTAEKTVDDLPMMLSRERYEAIVGKLDKTGQRALAIGYKEDEEQGTYIRNDSALKGLQLERALQAFEAAGYTEEDLQKDIEELGLDQTKPEPRVFLASIEYKLDGDSLVAKVPASSIQFPDDYPINTISLLSYFGAADSEATGAMLVPDGSGALIRLNNGKTRYPSYQQLVYGSDQTIARLEDAAREQEVRLPVFGLIDGDAAFLGIIEEGEAVASIQADVSGRLNSYNSVSSSFYVVNETKVYLTANDQERSLPKFQQHPTKADFAVRYSFFGKEEASYTGMAKYYQQYLQERGGLPAAKRDDAAVSAESQDVPFYLQMIGAISKQKHVLGIPYNALEPLTTFKQAESIVEEVRKLDISNIKVQFSGWFNNGLDHRVPSGVKVDGAIGGSKGLKQFADYAQKTGIGFFPDVAFVQANSSKGFDEADDASRSLRDEPAAVYPVERALNRRDRTKSPAYVVSPRLVPDYVERLLKGVAGYEIEGLSLRDLAADLNSDYRKSNEIDRTESQARSLQSLEAIRSANLDILANGGNAFTLPYVSDLTNAPMTSSRFKIEDEEIPFFQMVVRGYVEYAGAPYNLSTYTDPSEYILKSLEYGSGVYFEWIYEPNYKVKDTENNDLYAVNYEQWLALAGDIYKEVNDVLGQVQGQRIISHDKLDDGVYKTVFENGVYVIVNYNHAAVQVDGKRIEADSYATGGAAT